MTNASVSASANSQANPQSPRICIVGGGFGGLYTALYLQKYRHLRQSQITLVEPRERFVFTPMMYELITDELKEWEIAPTYSSLTAGTNIQLAQEHADAVDLTRQSVTLRSGKRIDYDYLVMATGAESRPMNIPGVDEHALPFRSFKDAQLLNARLEQISRAQMIKIQTDEIVPIPVTVVGGGASGVELACKVSDYFGMKGRVKGKITLVEHGDQLLKPFSDGIKKQARRALAQRQVDVLTQTGVTAVEADAVMIQSKGEEARSLPSQLTLWAVGTKPRPWLGEAAVPQNDRGQRLTRRSLQLVDYDNVFVLGDSADVRGPKGKAAPDTAQAAFQAADRVAANLAAMIQGKQPKPFNYLHLGNMITLGVGDAGLHSFGITLGGQLAALCRRGVYVFRMPTRRHQIKVGKRALAELFRYLLPPWQKHRTTRSFSR